MRRLLSNRGRIALTVDVGNGPVYSFNGYSTLSKYYFCDYGVGFHLDPEGIALNLHSGIMTCIFCPFMVMLGYYFQAFSLIRPELMILSDSVLLCSCWFET